MKILGLISSPVDPASRFRILQYKKYFRTGDCLLHSRYYHPLREKDPAAWMNKLKNMSRLNEWRTSNLLKLAGRLPLLLEQFQYDIIWQNRLLLPYHRFFEKKYKRPLVFDFDDAIWMTEGEKQVADTVRQAAVVFCGNEYLAGFGARYNSNVKIVPSTVDTDLLYPLEQAKPVFTIGWIGSKSNLSQLEKISPVLLRFLERNPDTCLQIVSSEQPGFLKFDQDRILFRQWAPEKENEYINGFSAGIMPLEDSEWTRGKCSYKMLQYMACGIPVIASPVGNNHSILQEKEVGIGATRPEEWEKALLQLKNENVLSRVLGANGRALVMDKYSSSGWAPVLKQYFEKIV